MKPIGFVTFQTWLKWQRDRDDDLGDLARDVFADPWSKRRWGLTGLLVHLESVDAEPEVVRGALSAFYRYVVEGMAA